MTIDKTKLQICVVCNQTPSPCGEIGKVVEGGSAIK